MTIDRPAARLALGFTLLHGIIALVVASIPLCYGTVTPHHMLNDVEIYYDYATRAMHGEIPYRDYQVEYPLLALPLFLIPRVFVSNFAQFRIALGVEMIVADGLAIYLVASLMGQTEPRRAVIRRLLWFSLLFCTFLPMSMCRFDLAVMTWTFAGAVAWGSRRNVLGGLIAGTGTLVKIVPGVAALPFFVSELASMGRRRGGMIAFVGSILASAGIWLAIGGPNVAKSFGYHIERGVEIGSLYSSILLAGAMLIHAPVESAYRHNSLEIVTPWSETIGAFGFPLQLLAFGAVAWQAYRSRGADNLRYATAAVLAFVSFGKVLSPQYMIWLIPFFACLTGRLGSQSRRLFFIAALATTLIFPLGFHWMLQFRNWAIGLLVYRNLILIKLWYDLTFSSRQDALLENTIVKRALRSEASYVGTGLTAVPIPTTLTDHARLM